MQLRAKVSDRSAPYNGYSPMPFGKYKDEPLSEVPDSYLEWWWRNNPDWDVIYIETLYAPFPERAFAKQKLKLHDYLKERYGNNQV